MRDEFKELNKIEEDLDTAEIAPMYKLSISNGKLIDIKINPGFDLVIPEGVTEITGYVDYRLFANYDACIITRVVKIVFPASLVKCKEDFFGTRPQYPITLEFKGDVLPIIRNSKASEMYIDRILKAMSSAKKEEYIERALCGILNVAYTKTTFIFDTPLNLDSVTSIDLELN